MYYYERDGVQALNRWRSLSVLDVESDEAWFWAPTPDAIPSWKAAAPLRAILHWWLGRRGILQLHGCEVGTLDGGVLLVGRGGSGKSTTSLACSTAGLRYAGDDYVRSPRIHSRGCTASTPPGKLEDHQLARFPGLGGAVGNPGREAGEKAVVYVEEAAPGRAIAGFPLRAILVRVWSRRCPRRAPCRVPPAPRSRRLRRARSSSSMRRSRTHSRRWPRWSGVYRASPSSSARTWSGSRSRSSSSWRLLGEPPARQRGDSRVQRRALSRRGARQRAGAGLRAVRGDRRRRRLDRRSGEIARS